MANLTLLSSDISFLDSLIYAVVGLIIVFLGIALLVGVLALFGYGIRKLQNRKQKEKVTVETSNEVKNDDSIPEDIKVAIISAVSAYMAKPQAEPCEFKVKRIKR